MTNSQHSPVLYIQPNCCLWLCKDTNLWPIHNRVIRGLCGRKVVYDYAKILICDQFTTIHSALSVIRSCLWLCKDTNLWPIHNSAVRNALRTYVVYDYAKILICDQFTTITNIYNSAIRCLWLCKDTNLWPIHNIDGWASLLPHVVYDYAKILICDQFTTTDEPGVQCKCCLWLCKDTNL